MSSHDSPQSKRLDRFLANVLQGRVDRICHINQVGIGWTNRSLLRQFLQKRNELPPIFGAHDDNREVLDFSSLNESEGLEQFVERARSAWHDNEGIGVLHEQGLSHKEVIKGD